MRNTATTAAELIGAALIVAGIACYSIPCALIAAGIAAILASWSVNR